jgi:PAS domain S-box-containing protein
MEPDLKLHFFEKLFTEITEGMVLADSQGRVLRVNREFCRMFGYTAEEVAGRCVDDLITQGSEHSAAATITEAVAHGRTFTLKTVRRRKDGSPVPVSLLALPVAEEREVVVFGVYRDISDRKQAERDLLARYGGEEFVAVLSGTPLAGAVAMAERMRQGVADLALAHGHAPAGRVTVSLGVAALVPGRWGDPMDLVRAADRALYQAKAQGRNQVAVADAGPAA